MTVSQGKAPASPPRETGPALPAAAGVGSAEGVSRLFPVVGVGASAGGLEAFTQMLAALPVDTGMAFVLVQHLAPKHASLLAELLSRTTTMPVAEVEDGIRIEPDHVYVIPPDCDLVIADGCLELLPREAPRGQHHPIDQFLRSLAADRQDWALGVVLSGNATDGALGLKEIKAEGGVTFAQNDTAQQSSMPRSAVATGCVDFVLSPAGIAREIGRIARQPRVSRTPRRQRRPPADEMDLQGILKILYKGTGADFSHYKAGTFQRRVSRRMALHKLQTAQDYEGLLRRSAAEVEALYQDVLIPVTRFFRDPESLEALRTTALAQGFDDRARKDPLRVWVLGCSTGEEAYSLAITLVELAAEKGRHLPVQIFATDLNAAGIDKARGGIYPKSIAGDVSPERLARFFAEVDGCYRVSKAIRDLCVFARHNVLTDPPFSQMDLISCRNVLIYLEPALQQKVAPLLHYALKPAGVLWLGSSESLGAYGDLFAPADARHKIYTRKPSLRRVAFGPVAGDARRPGRPGPAAKRAPPPWADVQKEADRILLARYVPPGVLVNADLEILQFRGDTGPYLAPAQGKASLNLLRMVRPALETGLRGTVQRARKANAAVREEGLPLHTEDGTQRIDLEVVPVQSAAAGENGFLILFEKSPPLLLAPKGKGQSPPRRSGGPARDDTLRLTQELASTREYLQSVIEQQEAANEELQSANEEAQSANEELQSVNEELETSKEEIQSSNEELATLNDELQNRNSELSLLNNDLFNLLGSIETAIVILGRDRCVRRFTPQAEKILHLLPADVGRPIGDICFPWSLPDLEPLLSAMFDTGNPQEREVRDSRGTWYSLRLRPYRTLEDRLDGAVLMLVDIDSVRRAREYAESIVATVREPLLVLDANLCVQTASQSFYSTFEVTSEETEKRFLYDLGDGQWDLPALRRRLEEMPVDGGSLVGYEVDREFPRIGRRTLLLNASRIFQEDSRSALTLLAVEDITARKQLETALTQRVEELAAADRSRNEFLALLAHELRNPLAPLRNAAHVLEAADGAIDGAVVEAARGMMHRQIQNMSRLIEDLLDVSRITGGQVGLRRERVMLATTLRQAVELVRHLIEARGQELSLALPAETVLLDADPLRLEQVFGNLLNNASKFTPVGGHLWLTAELPAGAPGEVVVRVRDDGIGIAAETLPQVFDLFVQAERSYDRGRGGLGIGLTVVHRLVELHGGRVEAHSAGLGEGSELVVHLPVLAAAELPAPAAPAARSAARAAAKRARPAVALPPRRILVVDDNVDTAESMALLLSLKGYDVATAHDGPAALEKAAAFHPEAVLLDIGLPGLDGYQVATRLRGRPRTAKALLVALTGYGQDEDRTRALAAGFDHHLTKPVDPQAIYDLLAPPGA